MAGAVTRSRTINREGVRGFGPALTRLIKVFKLSASSLHGFLFCFCQARRSPGDPFPAHAFEMRPGTPAEKIELPTAVRTAFESPGEFYS